MGGTHEVVQRKISQQGEQRVLAAGVQLRQEAEYPRLRAGVWID